MGWTFVSIIHILVCLILMFVVLLQQGKGGGMGAAFGGATTQVFGGRGAGNLLTRATAICAGIFMLTSVGLAYHSSEGDRALKKYATEQAGRKRTDKGQLKERPKDAPAESGEAPKTPPSPPNEAPKDEAPKP